MVKQKNTRVAFQGELGAYSQEALLKHFKKNTVAVPSQDFALILERVINDEVDYAILPVENSLAGSVIPAYDELIKFDLRIQYEVILKVKHCLLTLPEQNTQALQKVYSHPQALAQCSHHCKQLNITPHPFQDTAGAAKYISENKIENVAAIASELAAEIYGLQIVRKNFEDESFNFTRFFVMAKNDTAVFDHTKTYKTSIIFATRHQPNALVEVLNCLSNNGINLTKIESRPTRHRAWDYLFFVDFMGHEDETHVQKAFLSLLKHTSLLKVLGSYQSEVV